MLDAQTLEVSPSVFVGSRIEERAVPGPGSVALIPRLLRCLTTFCLHQVSRLPHQAGLQAREGRGVRCHRPQEDDNEFKERYLLEAVFRRIELLLQLFKLVSQGQLLLASIRVGLFQTDSLMTKSYPDDTLTFISSW